MKQSVPPYVHSFPAPAVIIGCGTMEKPNLITCGWFGTVCSEPPTVSVSIRRSRFSHDLLLNHREFTVNIPLVEQLDAVKFCGVKSGRDTDKFRELGLTPVPCPPLVNAPMIDEFFQCLGCRIKEIRELGSHDMFIAEVVSAYCRSEDFRRVRPDPHGDEQIAYLDGKYWQLSLLS
jgi:flavin reductase (DIM6/NTAB) family NADH-FMN oxidoreductase RutF